MAFWIVRQIFAVAVLPFSVVVLVPIWLARRDGIVPVAGGNLTEILLQATGVCLFGVGLFLFTASLRRFVTEGRGTLAPWDPPRQLVVRGPYRYVRNPMISGVICLLVADALVLLSWPHLGWALTFAGLNGAYLPLLEEPSLYARFGESYLEYCRHVPRFVPRVRPWDPE